MMHLSKHKLAILALIAANIIWGASFPIYKWALADIPPFTFVFLRFFIGAIILFPFVIKDLKIAPEDIGRLIWYSLTGITLTISLLFLGLKLAPSINAPIITSSTPILLIMFALLFLKNKPRKKVVVGTLIGLAGILIIVLRPIFENGFDLAVLGNLFFILACIADAISILLLQKIMKKYSAFSVVFWSFVIGIFPLSPFVMFEYNKYHAFNFINYQGIIGIAFASIASSAIGHSLNAFGARYITPSEIGIFNYVDPIATALVAIPLLGEQITFYYLLGSVFVFLGIFIAEGRIHYHPIHLLKKLEEE